MHDERDEVRARIDLVDLVSQRVSLKRAGKHWKGLCPFHDDRNPSFFVSHDTGRYKCWSCGEGGDAFTWVMKTQNVDFPEALKILAAQAGIELKTRHGKSDTGRTRYLETMREAQNYFRESFEKSNLAQDYCKSRELDQETIEKWGIGYAPSDDHALAMRLRKAGFGLADAKDLFLVEGDAGSGYFDKFRNRLMFPIHDERGDLIAFGGRALGDIQPKYVNSSDTPLFRKSRVLYGMNRAKDAIAKEKRAVLVEGYLDVLACHRAGVECAVASLGTSLAEDHAKLLRRWCSQATVLYDSDAAGQKAADRASEVLHEAGLVVRIASMPEGSDPDTLLRQGGPAAVQAAAKAGLTPTEFRMIQIEARLDPQDEAFWTEIVAAISRTDNHSEFERHLAYLRGKYLGGRPLLEEQLRQKIKEAQRALRSPGKGKPQARASNIEVGGNDFVSAERVVFRAFLEGGIRPEALGFLRAGVCATEAAKRLEREVCDAFPNDPPKGKPVEWLSELSESAQQCLAESSMQAVAESELVSKRMGDVTLHELRDAIDRLKGIQARKDFEQLKEQVESSDAFMAAFDALKQSHDRESARWE